MRFISVIPTLGIQKREDFEASLVYPDGSHKDTFALFDTIKYRHVPPRSNSIRFPPQRILDYLFFSGVRIQALMVLIPYPTFT